jgi:hypothetical protein
LSVFPPYLAPTYEFVGEWLSLVEHLVRDQGVGGSNPLSPTNLFSIKNALALEGPFTSLPNHGCGTSKSFLRCRTSSIATFLGRPAI